VHAGLVADLDERRQTGEDALAGFDDLVLGVPAEIGVVEVEQVVVLDAFGR
jgi:hypothetical protein